MADKEGEQYDKSDVRKNWEQTYGAYQRAQALGRKQEAAARQQEQAGRASDDVDIPSTIEEMQRRWKDPEVQRPLFEERFQSSYKGELTRTNEDGSETTYCAYELIIDPMDQQERRGWLQDFGLRAAQAGYHQAFAPIVLPNIGFTKEGKALTAIEFILEKPAGSATQPTPQVPDNPTQA